MPHSGMMRSTAATVYIQRMSTAGVRRARDALADIELVAQLRSAFADAQAVMGQTLAGFGLTEQRYHLLLVVAAGGPPAPARVPSPRPCTPPSRASRCSSTSSAKPGWSRRCATTPTGVMSRFASGATGRRSSAGAISVQREALHSLISTLEVTEVTRLAELVARTYLGLELSVSLKSRSDRPSVQSSPRPRFGLRRSPRPRTWRAASSDAATG